MTPLSFVFGLLGICVVLALRKALSNGVADTHGTDPEKQLQAIRDLMITNASPRKWLPILERASAQHYGPATVMLAQEYISGCNTRKDIRKGIALLTQAATADDPTAQLEMGRLYDYGSHVERNPSIAMEWYRKAAHNGNSIAPAMLGEMYSQGLGVPVDLKEAVRWYLIAAENGNLGAHMHLQRLQSVLQLRQQFPNT